MADLADGRGHLLRRGGDLVGLAGLGVGVAGGLDRPGADLGGGCRERLRALGDGLEHAADGGHAGVDPGENHDNKRAEQHDQQGHRGTDPGRSDAGLRCAVGGLRPQLCVNQKSRVCRRQRIRQRCHRRVRGEKIQRIPRLARGQQTNPAIARVLILLDCPREFLVLLPLRWNNEQIDRLQRLFVLRNRHLPLAEVIRGTCRSLTQHQLQVLAPLGADAIANGANINQGRKMTPADIRALCRDAPEGDEGECAQHNAQAADNAEGEDELAGDGEIAQPLHAGNPFSGDSRISSAKLGLT